MPNVLLSASSKSIPSAPGVKTEKLDQVCTYVLVSFCFFSYLEILQVPTTIKPISAPTEKERFETELIRTYPPLSILFSWLY